MVCIPHQGQWSAEFSDRVYSPLKYVKHPAFDLHILLNRGAPISVTRNMFAKSAIEDLRFTHVFMLDSDIIFESKDDPEKPMSPLDAIYQLLSCRVSVCSGLYRARQKVPPGNKFPWSAWVRPPNLPENELAFVPIENWSGNFFAVAVCGAGCLLVDIDVFRKVPPPWFSWNELESKPSEDFFFNLKAAKYGFKTFVFADVRCSHLSGNIKVLSSGHVTTTSV